MPIKIDCPRCKQSLSVPSKKAGEYATCPRCNGRFWVPGTQPGAPAGATASGPEGPGAATATSTGIPSAAPPPPTAPPQPLPPPTRSSTSPTMAVPPGTTPPPTPPAMISTPGGTSPPRAPVAGQPVPPRPPAPPSRTSSPTAGPGTAPSRTAHSTKKNVARFIASEATESTIAPAADGKLPELHLYEGKAAEATKEKGGSLNPLLLLGALCVSVALCIVLVAVDFEPPDQSNLDKRRAARYEIDRNYLSNLDPGKPLAPYQVYLREAQQARARGDRKAERRQYRKVLDLLRTERGPHDKGITGSHERDQILEKKISDLL